MRFTGTIEAKVDEKGRIFLPAPFRKILVGNGEEQLVLRKDDTEACLTLYPRSVWNGRMDELRARLNHWDSRHRALLRRYVADTETVTLDKGGRFLVPRRYLRMADIAQEVVFLGLDDVIELWPKGKEAATFATDDAAAAELEALMKTNEGQQ